MESRAQMAAVDVDALRTRLVQAGARFPQKK
jgi:hypothetical protein